MNSQLKRGTLEMCVLAIVSRADCYGYELVNRISECMKITEGTIYPLLKRLKEQNHIDSYIVESQEGPPRKYYTITSGGRDAYREQERQWREFAAGINKILAVKENGLHEQQQN
jgi:PadR family transcriptional regulator PadR